MPSIEYVLLYVADVARSAAFWAEVLGAAPVESSSGFAMFVLPNGLKLGLWLAPDVEPAANPPGGGEVCLPVGAPVDVDATHTSWRGRGWQILQTPKTMDFGYTFTGGIL